MDLNKRIKEELREAFTFDSEVPKAEIYREIGKKLKVHPERVRKHHRMMTDGGNMSTQSGDFTRKVDNTIGTIESSIEIDYEPKDDVEIAKLHKINTEKYKISSYWSKVRGNGKFTSSVLASLKKPKDYSPEDFANFLKGYKPPTLDFNVFPTEKGKQLVDIELSIADFHLDKKTLEGETLEDKKLQYLTVVEDLVNKVLGSFRINKIVFVIGNDYFHTDNYQNQTTNLTQQDVLSSFSNEYEEGFDLLVQTIGFLDKVSNTVDVILVQGNHDRTKSYYLAHALDVFFKSNKRITFNRDHSVTKHVVLGNTFIGYHHGNCKIDELPLLFATGEAASDFGNALYREVHTGDKHHYLAKEVKGVRIQQMPSLSGTDRWHMDHNFVHSIRAGLVFVYDKESGKLAEFESRI